ncbi:MAG TPA: hypothetical protein VJ417_09455, partial [Candidatus Glassbacteria bacterium]|nr:hypothetical protein [Candidatus Glassbacteria bacterium]
MLLFAVLGLLACSDRPRSNPLDPRNSDQNQANVGFNALAGNRQVLLEWNPLNFIDLAGIRVQRVEAGTSDTVTLNDSLMLQANTTSYLDQTPSNGVTYLYNLQFDLTSGSEKPKTMPDTVQPGPVFAWLELVDYGQIVLMTPDFRDELHSIEAAFYNILDVQVGRSVWVLNGSSDGYGQLSLFSFSGQIEEENLGGLSSVVAFQLNRRDNSVWIAVGGSNGFVYHFSNGGNLQDSRSTGISVTSLALDQQAADLWVGSSEPTIARINLFGESVVKISHSS